MGGKSTKQIEVRPGNTAIFCSKIAVVRTFDKLMRCSDGELPADHYNHLGRYRMNKCLTITKIYSYYPCGNFKPTMYPYRVPF